MNCDIKCPKCGHKYMYDFKIDDIDENSKFSIFLICKNPLCNYDMEVMGKLIKSRDENLDNVDITKVK